MKYCPWCHRQFWPKRRARCCSDNCRYSLYHARHREQRCARMRVYNAQRWATMTQEQYEQHRIRQRKHNRKHNLAAKVAKQWSVSITEARRYIDIGSFPP